MTQIIHVVQQMPKVIKITKILSAWLVIDWNQYSPKTKRTKNRGGSCGGGWVGIRNWNIPFFLTNSCQRYVFLVILIFEHAVCANCPGKQDMTDIYEHETESDEDCEVYCKYETNACEKFWKFVISFF